MAAEILGVNAAQHHRATCWAQQPAIPHAMEYMVNNTKTRSPRDISVFACDVVVLALFTLVMLVMQ